MEFFCHWLTELAEVYTHHAGRHGPNRLLPAQVLPTHDCVPGHGGAALQGTGPERTPGGALCAQGVQPPWIELEENHTMAHDARHGTGRNGHGAVDRDRLREEIHLLEMSLCYWQARLQHMPGSAEPGTPRDQIQHMIDLLHQELGLKRLLESS